MLAFRHLLLFACVTLCLCQVTLKKNPLLSRKRRYLSFPEGSNLVMTMSYVKSVMVQIPRLVNVLGECDVPFKLPSDPRFFWRTRGHYRQRREIYSQLEDALTGHGFDGNACVKRMICDAERYLPPKGKSLVGDILSAIFTFSADEPFEGDGKFQDYCRNSTYEGCKLPLLHLIVGSLLN